MKTWKAEWVAQRRAGFAADDAEAAAIQGDVLKTQYKALLMKKEDANMAADLERRQIGEQFRLLDPARIPERPIGPNRWGMAVFGALVGFGVGLMLLLVAALRRSVP